MQLPPRITTHLVQIEQAVRNVTMGQIAIEEFEALVDRLEKMFRQQLAEVEAVEVPPDFLGEMSDELQVGRAGVGLYIEAMGDFRVYLRERSLDILSRGLDKARRANDMVNEALARNWKTYNTYRQSTEEYLYHVHPDSWLQR